jgi:hypothetical protein
MVLLLCVFVAAAFAVQAAAQCPTITAKGPAGITPPGEDITFRAEINVVGPKFSFSWSVDKGTITSGQGTREITITTFGLSGEAVTATVEVGGLPSECDKRASESAGIDQRIVCGLAYDEWDEKVSLNDQRGRLDSFFASLANNPGNIGVIVLRVKHGDKLDPTNSRIKFMLKHIKFREVDKSQFWFFLEQSEERSTRLHIVPPGTEPPCEGCLLFKGGHL